MGIGFNDLEIAASVIQLSYLLRQRRVRVPPNRPPTHVPTAAYGTLDKRAHGLLMNEK